MRLLEVTFLKDTGLKVAGWLRPSSVIAAAIHCTPDPEVMFRRSTTGFIPCPGPTTPRLALEVEHLGPVSIVWDHQGEAFLNELTGVPRNKEKP